MLLYSLICLSLVLLGITGLQFTYMFYLDRVDKQRKHHIHDLELQCKKLAARLSEAEERIANQDELIARTAGAASDEVWADIIDDR
ncbi:MAG: hypothetical protein ACK4S4_08370 [Pyrinomonadaceae bacterium]